MKGIFDKKPSFSKKNMILAAVAVVLIVITAVGTSVSWIEEVSQVEFSSMNGQQTPMHIGAKKLDADVAMRKTDSDDKTVDLSRYFYESGDMHLSPCYGDGENFYFPVEGSGYRSGTKDDANVNYLSATFRLTSENANTAYWFEKVNASTPFIGLSNQSLEQYLRCSITVDGLTTVYALNNTGDFYTIENSAPSVKHGRRMNAYSYYDEEFDQSTGIPYSDLPDDFDNNYTTTPYNRGSGNGVSQGTNLNGNTLFTVNNGVKKTVTVKIWLEYSGSNVLNVSVANLNIKLVSSWAKTRRIFVKDATVQEYGSASPNWLAADGHKLYWALTSTLADEHPKFFEATSIGGNYYSVDIPAVYNNTPVILFCATAWDTGSNTCEGIHCTNYWATTLPDTFHSGVYTVYTSSFGTWDENDASAVYFINSASFSSPKAYMWDSNSVHGGGIDDKVVKNANWPGVDLTRLSTHSSKGWDFNAASGADDKLCTLNTDTSQSGYYTFRLSKAATNVLYVLVTFDTIAPVTSYTEDSDYYLHVKNDTDYCFKKISDSSFIFTKQYSANQTIKFNIKKDSSYFGNSGTINKTNYNPDSAFSMHTFYYTSDYDKIIFSDGVTGGANKEYQTQDLTVKNSQKDWSNKTFDMSTLTWFDANPLDTANLPYFSHSNTYLYSNIVSGRRWVQTRFAYGGQYSATSNNAFNGTSTDNMLCKIYNKTTADNNAGNSSYECLVYIDGDKYGADESDNKNLSPDGYFELKKGEDKKNITLYQLLDKTIYRVYLKKENGTYKLYLREGAADTTESN